MKNLKRADSVQSHSRVQFFTTLLITACRASLSITSSQSWLKLISIESVMPSNHLILCRPLLLLLPSIFPSIRLFSNESALHIRWTKYWSFSFSISPSNEHSGLISLVGWTGWISLQSKGLSTCSLLSTNRLSILCDFLFCTLKNWEPRLHHLNLFPLVLS